MTSGALPESCPFLRVVVRDRVKFRVGRYVYLAFSRDETVMGFGYLREERDAWSRPIGDVPAAGPGRRALSLGAGADGRARRRALRELVVDAWRIAAPNG